jgi:hypothetical protein
MISIQSSESFIEMHLIEVAKHNFGKAKKYAGVAGNLVAFACRSSFDLGFDGVVAFTAMVNKPRAVLHVWCLTLISLYEKEMQPDCFVSGRFVRNRCVVKDIRTTLESCWVRYI